MRPTTLSAALTLILLGTCGSLHAESPWVPMGNDIQGEAHRDSWGADLDVNHNGTVIAAAAYANAGNGVNAGHVRSYAWNGIAWVQRGTDIDGLLAWDWTARTALDRSGSVLAVGSSVGIGGAPGYVRVYDWSGTDWVLRGAPITGESGARFGSDLDLSGNGASVAIGADDFNGIHGSRSGRTRIYDWNGIAWVQRGPGIDGEASQDFSGRRVELSDDANTVAISATGNDAGGQLAGQVRVFDWTGSDWVQRGADLDGSGHQVSFGADISLSADGARLAVGAPQRDVAFVDDGEVRVYDWNGVSWQQVGQSIADGDDNLDRFGGSVSLSAAGDLLVVGGHEYTNTSGTARIYRSEGGLWRKLGTDLGGLGAGERFATAVAFSGDGSTLVSSAPLWRNSSNQELGYVRALRAPNPSGCDTLDPTPVNASVEFETIQAIFTGGAGQEARCTTCHSPNVSAGLSLAPENAFAALVNVDSSQDPTIKRVVPFSSSASLLFRKVNCNDPGVGLRMPRGRPALSLDEQRLIRDWIDQGALQRQRVLINGFE